MVRLPPSLALAAAVCLAFRNYVWNARNEVWISFVLAQRTVTCAVEP